MRKGFDQRDMLLKHIPYISLTCPVDLTHKYPLSFSTTEETEKKRNSEICEDGHDLCAFSHLLYERVRHSLGETMAVSGKKCLKRQ